MKKRAITGVFIVLVTAIAIVSKLLCEEIFDVFIAIIAVIASSEMCNLFNEKNRQHNRFVACMYAIVLYMPIVFGADNFTFGQLFLFMLLGFLAWSLVGFIWQTALCLKNKGQAKDILISGGNTVLIGIYPGIFVSMFFLLNHLTGFSAISNKYLTLWMIVLVFAVTMLSDTFAYLIGSALKGPKVCPKISPNKSWSGCIGGLLGGVIGAFAIYGILQINALNSIIDILNLNVGWFIFIGVFGSIISQIGDFFESYLKRRAGVKDSGNLFPGHGGMLDRIDALMFNVMFITLFLIIMI